MSRPAGPFAVSTFRVGTGMPSFSAWTTRMARQDTRTMTG